MFSKASKSTKQDKASTKTPPSIISSDFRITGDLVSEGELQIDGLIEGDVSCKVLIIGQTGTLTGAVKADTVRIHGCMNGTVRARSVVLASSARMIGDITHESLAIEPGAFMDGRCNHMKDVPKTLDGPEDEKPLVLPGTVARREGVKDARPVDPSGSDSGKPSRGRAAGDGAAPPGVAASVQMS